MGPPVHEASGELPCSAVEPAAADNALPSAEALSRAGLSFAGGAADPVAYAETQRRLTSRLQATLAELPADDFNITWALSHALRCALIGATASQVAVMWGELERVLAEQPATPFAIAFAFALRPRPAPAPQLQRILRAFEAHSACGVRAAALTLRNAAANDEASRAQLASAAQAALRSSCWRLQAAGIVVLRRIGMAPDGAAPLPSFLRAGSNSALQ